MSNDNFFTRIFSSLLDSFSPDNEKKRQIRNIAKAINKSKYKFFKTTSSEAQPALAKFFYDLYKITRPAQTMFKANSNLSVYKNWVISSALTPAQKEAEARLSEEAILLASKTSTIEEIEKQVKQDLELILNSFTTDTISKVDSTYATFLSFISLCSFDFYFVIKKFASDFKENDFSVVPRFESIRSEYIVDDIKDFLAVFYTFSFQSNEWVNVFSSIKDNRGIEPISLGIWNKVLTKLKNVKDSEILELIVQFASENPSYRPEGKQTAEHITEPWIDKLKASVNNTIGKIKKAQVNSKEEELTKQIFDSGEIIKLKFYTQAENLQFLKKNIEGYLYCKPLNYLKAFLLDFVKKDIREFTDLVVIRGKWLSTSQATSMSDNFNSLLEKSDEITTLDNNLSETGEVGLKFKTYLLRVDREKEVKKVVTTLLNDVNDIAKNIILTASQEMITIGKLIKLLLTDHEKTRGEVISNWKEIDRFAEHPIKENGINIYKKLYLFVSLLQIFMTENKSIDDING